MIELLLTALIAYGSGFATAWFIKDEPIIVRMLDCPSITIPDKIEAMIVRDCTENCPNGFDIKMDRESRGNIDRFAKDCRSKEKSIENIIDSYNQTIREVNNGTVQE